MLETSASSTLSRDGGDDPSSRQPGQSYAADVVTRGGGGGEHACNVGVMLRDREGCDSNPALCVCPLIAELIAPSDA